jgi:IclR family transcriptional regulator, acetate operon repressor
MATQAAPIRRKAKATARQASHGASERSGQVQSLTRALAILNAVAEADDGISLTEVAQQVGLPPSTTHRLLTTLQQDHFVRFDNERALWSVGVQSFIVGNAFLRTRRLVQTARPHLRALMEESGETVNLAVEDDGHAIFLHQVECRQMMRAQTTLGSRVPLHCSGVGKALLMAMAESRLAKILHRHGLPRLTARTIVRPTELRADLATSGHRSYALDDEEHAVGLRCVAAVILDELGEPAAAISISGPAARITDDRIPLLGDMVRRTAAAITAEYGGCLGNASQAEGVLNNKRK